MPVAPSPLLWLALRSMHCCLSRYNCTCIARQPQLQSLCPGFRFRHRGSKGLHALMPSRVLNLVQLGPIAIYCSCSFWFLLLSFFVCVCLCLCVFAGGVDICEFGRQVGNASVYLRLLLRSPRPLPAEKKEKEETRGAASGLRDGGLTIWDLKYTQVYLK